MRLLKPACWMGTTAACIFFLVVPVKTGAEGFYKDLFVDAAAGLTHATTLPAADTLDLAWERLSTSSIPLTLEIIAGTVNDSNGRLLYPDGSPRYRMMYVHGGQSDDHGTALGPLGRQRMVDFYNHGGSYSGSCAGAILATENTGTIKRSTPNPLFLHIYPGATHYTQLHNSATDMIIPGNSALNNYYDFGSEGRIPSVNHNGGNYVIEDDAYYWAPGTEILATYSGPVTGDDSVYQNFLGHGSVWAYKSNEITGRMVLLGSHPEGVKTGPKLRLFSAALQYALAGIGKPAVKAELRNNEIRTMNDNARTGFEKIGDRQYHHFTITVPQGVSRLKLDLEGEAGYQFALYAAKNGFALASRAGYQSSGVGNVQALTVENPGAGVWYIGVELKTSVTTIPNDWGPSYVEALPVLNGVSYNINAETVMDITSIAAPSSLGKDGLKWIEAGPGAAQQFEIQVQNAGDYSFELYTLSGQNLLKENLSLNAGVTKVRYQLGGFTGNVVGLLKGRKGSLSQRWKF